MALFIFVVLNLILRAYGFSLWHYLKHIREEIVLVLGTSSSEAALPRMLEKMERYGCAKSVVGLVIPAGYSFNLDGTSIYLSMAAMFIAQAFNVDLSIGAAAQLLGVLMLTSKGAAGVTGSGFIVLASTLSAHAGRAGGGRGAGARRRPVHERSARDHEPDREWRGDARDREARSVRCSGNRR